jgi:5-hydroxyisourate hydrolase
MPALQAPAAAFEGAPGGRDPPGRMALDSARGRAEHWRASLEGQSMSGLTTHILDQAVGRPAAGVLVRVSRRNGEALTPVAELRTDEDGRARLIAGDDIAVGGYRLEFSIGEHFKATGAAVTDPPFLDVVVIDFAVSNVDQHWHVPLLVSPYGYSTYRGS